ncbi:hypothetical protein GOV05_04285 [Candidatus Woesearchaeota archaeon]|nr:hypothetical protein [Candidatus Woesearchaeota archaeon]
MKTRKKDIEKKVRKQIRTKKLIKKNASIIIKNSDSLETQALILLLKNIIKDPTIKVRILKKTPKLTTKTSLAIPTTIEDESKNYLLEWFENKKVLEEKHIIKPISTITRKECEEYLKKNKVAYTKQTKKTDEAIVDKFISEMQKKHPQTMNSIIKTKEALTKK